MGIGESDVAAERSGFVVIGSEPGAGCDGQHRTSDRSEAGEFLE